MGTAQALDEMLDDSSSSAASFMIKSGHAGVGVPGVRPAGGSGVRELPLLRRKGASPGRAATVRSAWSIADRVFRVLIWVVGLSALIYFWIFLWAYHTGRDELLFRLARYIPRLH